MSISRRQNSSMSELRDFLRSEGASVPPWSTYQKTIEKLFGLLWTKKDDELFWSRLKGLMTALESNHFNKESVVNSEVIPNAAEENLLSLLREGIRECSKEVPVWSKFYRSTGAAGFLGFLVLAAALGCTDTCDEIAKEDGIDDVEVYCDLVHIIDNADIPWTVRVNLLDCLPQLDVIDRSQWLDAFQNASDSHLAEMLEEFSMDWQCDEYQDGWNSESGH